MEAIALLIATGRTATFAVFAAQNHHSLSQPLSFEIADAEGPVDAGVTWTVVFTVSGLQPGHDYVLRIGGDELAFSTRDESLLRSITEFGADRDADNNASAIQSAIDSLPDHATLLVPEGVWKTGPLFLKSRMVLLLSEGAVLEGVADRSAHAILPARHGDGRVLGTWEGLPESSYASLLTALDCEDLAIVGSGVIDGGGDRGDWWTWPKETREGARRPRTIFISHGRHIRLAGVTVRNSPSWTIHPVFCSDVVAAGLTIESDPESPNTDGLNPECCRDVLLAGIRFSVGDDCIAIKAGKRDPVAGLRGGLDRPTENVTIRNCLMERGHGGVVIGSEMSAGVRHVRISRCEMHDTDRGLRIKTRRGRGGQVSDVVLEDCRMDGVLTPIAVNAFYFCDADGRSEHVQSRKAHPVTEATPRLGSITIRRLQALNVHVAAAALLGLPEAPIDNVVIEDFTVTYAPEAVAGIPVMACDVEPVRHGGIISQNVHFSRMTGVDIAASQLEEHV